MRKDRPFWFWLPWALLVVWPLFAQSTSSSKPKPSVPDQTQISPVLLFRSDMDCMLTIDGKVAEVLKAGALKQVEVALGEHLVTAVSADARDRWETVVAADKPVQKVVLIELLKVRTTRANAELEAARLEQEIKTKQQQSKQVVAATQELARQQEAVKRQRAEIEAQIVELQKQIRQEQSSAQDDDARAAQLRQDAMSQTAQGNSLGKIFGNIGSMGADNAMKSARQHRARVGQLQDQITDLNLKLQGLNSAPNVSLPNGSSPASGGSAGTPTGVGQRQHTDMPTDLNGPSTPVLPSSLPVATESVPAAKPKDVFTFFVRYTPSNMSTYKSGLLTVSRDGVDLKRRDTNGLRNEVSWPCSELPELKSGFADSFNTAFGQPSFLIKSKSRGIRLYDGVSSDKLASAIQQACSFQTPASPTSTGLHPVDPAAVQQVIENSQQVKARSNSPQTFEGKDGQVSVSSDGIQFRNPRKPKDSFTLTCGEILTTTSGSDLGLPKDLVFIRTAAKDYYILVRDPTGVTRAVKTACAPR